MIELIAHQGGWDEILLVAGPLAVFAAVLMMANKRAKAKLAERLADDETDRPDGTDGEADIGQDPDDGAEVATEVVTEVVAATDEDPVG